MPAYFTRARHPELGDTVLPAAALEAFPAWQAYGDPSTDPDALRAEIALEPEPPAQQTPAPKTQGATGPVRAPAAEPSAPAGAAPKE